MHCKCLLFLFFPLSTEIPVSAGRGKPVRCICWIFSFTVTQAWLLNSCTVNRRWNIHVCVLLVHSMDNAAPQSWSMWTIALVSIFLERGALIHILILTIPAIDALNFVHTWSVLYSEATLFNHIFWFTNFLTVYLIGFVGVCELSCFLWM